MGDYRRFRNFQKHSNLCWYTEVRSPWLYLAAEVGWRFIMTIGGYKKLEHSLVCKTALSYYHQITCRVKSNLALTTASMQGRTFFATYTRLRRFSSVTRCSSKTTWESVRQLVTLQKKRSPRVNTHRTFGIWLERHVQVNRRHVPVPPGWETLLKRH